MTEVKTGLSSIAVYSAVLSALSDEGGSPRIKGRTTFRAPPLLCPSSSSGVQARMYTGSHDSV